MLLHQDFVEKLYTKNKWNIYLSLT